MKVSVLWTKVWLLAVLGTTTTVVQSGAGTPAAAPEVLTFEHHVRPVFKAMCFHCHGQEDEKRGGLDLRLVGLMQSGGDSGPVIVPGDAKLSLVWQRIESDEMPEGSVKLTSEQKAVIKNWIDGGAQTARPEPENLEVPRFSFEELGHWAFQPVKRPAVPQPQGYPVMTPVDGFIAERLSEHGVSFSPLADRRTLCRRVSFDLTGLPPTVEEVNAFVNDASPDAYLKFINRLLASPQFGVRWGRHWLDVAGFAESNGEGAEDTLRGHAWRYRDYVIDAFNTNKPVDEFIREQLAGDEMLGGEIDIENERHVELLTATGFLRMGPDPTQRRNELADRNQVVTDAVRVISSAIVGLTVHCAQCHDHKYEPIGIDDYYRFRAIFDPVFPLDNWQQPEDRLLDMTVAEVCAEFDQIEAEAKAKEDDLNARRDAFAAKIQQEKLAAVPEGQREAVRVAVSVPRGDRTPQQQVLLDQHPMVRSVKHIVNLLIEYDSETYKKFKQEEEEVSSIRERRPPRRMIMATTELPGIVPKSAVFFRGNPQSPGDTVEPDELSILSCTERNITLPNDDETLPTTGRRTAYAQHLTDGTHPLTARVFVNRVWMHHMGRGLVATPGDFGIFGARPSHPELLDWLADDFVRHGWDQKRLHRIIMLSTTYQQQSTRTPQLETVDPENALYGRMNLRRLEAEAIRDSILAVCGQIDLTLGGASVSVNANDEGKAVVGGAARDAMRRSVFIQVQRNLPLNTLATFDQPVMDPNCEFRQLSTVATQSLWFLNDSLIVQHAEDLAKLLIALDENAPGERMRRLYERLFAANITEKQRKMCQEFLARQTEWFRNDPDPSWQKVLEQSPGQAERRAFASLCQTLLASNRFLYVD